MKKPIRFDSKAAKRDQKMLLTDEEDEALLARDDKTDMTEELLPECMTWESRRPREVKRREEEEKILPRDKTWTREEKREYTTWEQWSLWDQFGSTGEIIQAFEEVAEGGGRRPLNREEQVNVDDAFWNITMSATSQDSGLDTPRGNKSSNQQIPSTPSKPSVTFSMRLKTSRG